jgi:hypothetical protein
VTFISIHSVIICVIFFGACMRCIRLCPLKPGCDIKQGIDVLKQYTCTINHDRIYQLYERDTRPIIYLTTPHTIIILNLSSALVVEQTINTWGVTFCMSFSTN